jgi:hypothetical protein
MVGIKHKRILPRFACIPGLDIKMGRPLLAFSPLLDETNQSSTNHADWVKSTLALYNKGQQNLLFLVSDNTNSMPKLASLLKRPFICCSSHRLALFVKQVLEIDPKDDPDDPIHVVNKVRRLMKKLRLANKAVALRLETHLKPLLSNATRWSSTFMMIQRYNQIAVFVDRADPDLIPLLLNPVEDKELRSLETTLKKINDVTVALQAEDVTLATARFYLDGVAALDIPSSYAGRYITQRAKIVRFGDFEAGITVLTGDEHLLTNCESNYLKPFLQHRELPKPNGDSSGNFAVDIINSHKRRKNSSMYMDLSFIPATSVMAEREFSKSSLVFNELRSSMTPHLECVIMLKHSSMYWDACTVQEVLNNDIYAS